MGSMAGILLAIAVLFIGWIISSGIKKFILKLLERTKIEEVCAGSKWVFQVGSISSLFSIMAFWISFILFINIAIGIPSELEHIAIKSSLFIPRILLAFILVMVSLVLSDLLIYKIKRKSKLTASRWDILYLAIRCFILLIFLQLSLKILSIDVLEVYLTPVRAYMAKIILASSLILISIGISYLSSRFIIKVLESSGFYSSIEEFESVVIRRKGMIKRIITYLIYIAIIIFFLQLSLNLLNIQILIDYLDIIIKWIPDVITSVLIILVSWWSASWIASKFEGAVKKLDMPFMDVASLGIKGFITFVGITIAIEQLGISVTGLYVVLIAIVVALAITISIVFGFGFKDIGANFAYGLLLKRTAEVGDTIVLENIEGKIESISGLTTTIITKHGKVVLSNKSIADANIIKKRVSGNNNK